MSDQLNIPNTPSLENSSKGTDSSENFNPIGGELLAEYNLTRKAGCRDVLCHAPYKTMYFGHYGNVRSCCYNLEHVWGVYPDQSVKDIWQGASAELLRTYIDNNDLSLGCESCKNHMEAKHFDGIKSKMCDELPLHDEYPTAMEFELNNTCNLECIMCSGEFSSSIRSNREKKTPIESPYDASFVEQLNEFIPHLHETKYYGGEPFLVELYYQLWDKIVAINPKCRISIQTNATILNNRVKNLLDKGNFHLNISLDSLDKSTYEAIRVNARFETVMENIQYFHKYCNSHNTFFGISTCVMKQNWKEIPDFIRFCNKLNSPAYFHTVWYPSSSSLWSCKSEKLMEIHDYFKGFSFPGNTETEKKNKQHFDDLVLLISKWAKDQLKEENYHKHIRNSDVYSLRAMFMEKLKSKIDHQSTDARAEGAELKIAKAKTAIESIESKEALRKAIYGIGEIPLDVITAALDNETVESIREKILSIKGEE